MPRTAASALLLLVPLLLVTGCLHGSPTARTLGSITGVRVAGSTGERPSVELTGLKVRETTVRTLREGAGPRVALDRVFVLHLTIVNARTGETAVSTYDDGRTAMAVTDSDATLFPVLTHALVGQRQGARVLVAATAEDTYGEAGAPQYGIRPGDPLVLVADVVAVPPEDVLDGPEGIAQQPSRPAPQVAVVDGEPTRIVFGVDGRPLAEPGTLAVVPLISGTGPAVEANDLVTLDYLGQVWGRAEQFANTYADEPVTVALGADRVIPAWERALVGVRRGSRVLVLTPPALAFDATGNPPDIPGNASLAYVIDVLGVS